MGFKQSSDKIYSLMVEEGLAAKWKSEDFISLFERFKKLGFAWSPDTGKYDRLAPNELTLATPWCHTRPEPRLKCSLDHSVLFNEYGIISTRCLNCWKVVVTPRTFSELLTLEKIQIQMDCPSKCGIEVRDYVPKFYGGYFYNVGPEAGLRKYKEVREVVDEVISPDVSVILKRGCTEYEHERGSNWSITEDQLGTQQMIDLLVTINNGLLDQPNFVKSHVRRGWMLWAHMNGDFSYVDHNNGKKLFPEYKQYQDMSLEEIKESIKIKED